ncbi:DUF1501 domain-containing protein [Wenxinia marina]|uniref:DUF1501 domain-containing protein n=1 Tax=Wenxinia marina DSM 24838 TaxID=1123501 RepID=A0A0D0QBH0_9RHOB|nr:DUF1501 domain-containing protein [Wenxinia marina]KIQ69622.1 hypothetical protein Wenmar_01986 [Wenxinia marina DSM 24838]GGL59815.1 hypothetical protein GCM10011392_12920 [Wenxinia marina]
MSSRPPASPSRRRFLAGGLALGCSAAASPLVTPIALASAPWDNRLVVVILRGAMDGLDAIRPVGDPDYAALGREVEDGPPGDGFWARHPALAPLDPLWAAGEMAAAHAVSTPYRDRRSHFDGQDLLEAGGTDLGPASARSGWLNRLIETVPGTTAEIAYAVGRERMAILDGPAAAARWSPDARLALSPATQQLLELVQHEDPAFRDASREAIAIAAEVAGQEAPEAGEDRRGAHVQLARFAAGRLRAETRIASFSLSGWDTHARQSQGIGVALGRLADVVLTLREGLGPVWEKTAVLCVTEFGRTARLNGSGGSDHGTGGAMLLAGGALRGGRVVADWPGLSEAALYDRRDLMPTRDVRAHAGWVMRGLFGLDAGTVESAVFPGLDLGPDPRWTL